MSLPIRSFDRPLDPAGAEPPRRRAQVAYDAAADRYPHPALGFWHRYGRQTVERVGLRPGMHVLDLASGSGSTALPAALRVGPTGRVIAVDLSDRLLEHAREAAARAGLRNLDLRRADMTATGYPDATFDAVTCTFGLFFATDMPALVRDAWRMLRPGGRLAITTWGPDLWAPMYDAWRDAIRDERPGLVRDFSPWELIMTPVALLQVLARGGIPAGRIELEIERGTWPLRRPDDWWTIVRGTGMRWATDQLGPAAAERVRRANLARIRADGITDLTTNVLYAVATKPD
jgi:SAM-dependent methyltransferase